MARPRHMSDEDLLDIARDVFAAEGAHASTATIADRAGLSQAALFKRFGTKERILRAALAMPEPRWVQAVSSGPDDRPARDQLQAIGHEMLLFFRELVPRVAVLRSAGFKPECMFEGQDEPPPVRSHRALSGWFRAAMERGAIRDSNPDVLAFVFLGPFQSRAFWAHTAGADASAEEDAAFVAAMIDVFWRGIAPEGTREG